MKLYLKKFEYSESPHLSQETLCYSAEVWIDNVQIGYVSNAGHGGSDHLEYLIPNRAELSKRLEAAADSLPDEEQSMDGFAGLTMEVAEMMADVRKQRRVLFRHPDKEYDEDSWNFAEVHARSRTATEAYVRRKYPGAELLPSNVACFVELENLQLSDLEGAEHHNPEAFDLSCLLQVQALDLVEQAKKLRKKQLLCEGLASDAQLQIARSRYGISVGAFVYSGVQPSVEGEVVDIKNCFFGKGLKRPAVTIKTSEGNFVELSGTEWKPK